MGLDESLELLADLAGDTARPVPVEVRLSAEAEVVATDEDAVARRNTEALAAMGMPL